MWTLIIAGIVLYYLIICWKFRDGFFKGGKTDNGSDSFPDALPDTGKNTSIMGNSRFRLSHVKPSEAVESHISKPKGNAPNFDEPDSEDTPQPMDIEVEMTYGDEPEDEADEAIEDEDIACFTGEESPSAQGITFEEMGQAADVVCRKSAPEAQERQALQTLSAMEQTGLYDTMIDRINGGRLRVAEMLQKYDFVFVAPPAQTTPNGLSDFNINDYL